MKKVLFAAMAAIALLAGCAKEPTLALSDNSETLEYKASTFDVEVTSGGNWNLAAAEDYTWISASKSSGMAGDVITFTTQLNVTGKIRSAKFNVLSGEQTQEISITQKSGVLDAVLSLSLVNVAQGAAIFDLGIQTSNVDDYKEYGVYYATEADLAKAQRKVLGTDVAAGTKSVTLDGLQDNTEYFAWPFIVALTGEEVVLENALKVVPPICVDDPAMVQETINAAAEYSVIRLLGGMVVTGGIEMKSNITVSGGWSQDFSAQNADKTVIEGGENIAAVYVPEGTTGAVVQNLELTKGNVQSVDTRATGGGVRAAGDITVENCYIHHNRAFSRGGGVASADDKTPEHTIIVVNSVISHNVAEDSHGAGIFIGTYGKLIMINSLVTGNWNQEPDKWSSALMTYGSTVMINNTITKNYHCGTYNPVLLRTDNNEPTHYWVNNIVAGGYYADESQDGWVTIEGWSWDQFASVEDKYALDPAEPIKLEVPANCVFLNNLISASEDGTGISVNDGSTNRLEGNVTIPYDSDFNILFSDFANDEYTLCSGSPAINIGTTSDPVASEYLTKYAKDLAGNARVAGSKVDAGCYELQ